MRLFRKKNDDMAPSDEAAMPIPPVHYERHWQRVPRINLLSPPRQFSARIILLRVLLVLAILLTGFLLQAWYLDKQDHNDAIERAGVEIASVQQDLDVGQQALAGLETQVSELRQARDQAEARLEQATVGRVDWGNALGALYLAQAQEGVSFTSVSGATGGQVTVVGTFADLVAKAAFDQQIERASQLLELLSIRVESLEGLRLFTATFQIKQ